MAKRKFENNFNDKNVNSLLLYNINEESLRIATDLILLASNYMDAFLLLSTQKYKLKLPTDLAIKLIELVFQSPHYALLLVRASHGSKSYVNMAKEPEIKFILELLSKEKLKNNNQVFKIFINKLKYWYNLDKKIKRLKLSPEVESKIISMMVTTSLLN